MSRTYRISEIKAMVRERCDMEKTNFIEDETLLRFINSSYAELYDLLVESSADYYADYADFTLSSDTDIYQLPGNFYKLLGVDVQISGDWKTLKPFKFSERNKYAGYHVNGWFTTLRYRLLGNTLAFNQEPPENASAKLWYVPAATKYTSDDQLLDGVNGWEEYVIVDCCIKCLRKEESDTSEFMAEKMALKKRIEQTAEERDPGMPSRIADVRGLDDEYDY